MEGTEEDRMPCEEGLDYAGCSENGNGINRALFHR